MNYWLLKYIRISILIFSAILSAILYLYVAFTIPESSLFTIRLVQSYALTAITFLYFTLLISPLYTAFPFLPQKPIFIKSRQALGLSALYFALLHAALAFFKLLGGIPGLAYLGDRYLNAVIFGFTSLCILIILGITSHTLANKLLGKNWKKVHRLVYVAGFSTLIHALMLGSHFSTLSETIPMIILSAITFLLILEAFRLDRYITSKIPSVPSYLLFLLLSSAIGIVMYNSFWKTNPDYQTLRVHSSNHTTSQTPMNHGTQIMNTFSKKYSATVDLPKTILPNTEIPLNITIRDQTDTPITTLSTVYEKPIHLIIVDSSLEYFNHIHPVQEGNSFKISTTFPRAGTYYMYLDYQPLNDTEQQQTVPVNVGIKAENRISNQKVDTNLTKTFNNLSVTLKSKLSATELENKNDTIEFAFKDVNSGKPIVDIQPYLNSFGHLVMINQKTYQYIHVHPTKTVKNPNARTGPFVEFMPMAINNKIDPGIYRVFGQFNINGNLQTIDYTIELK